jgi:hypothetical protein
MKKVCELLPDSPVLGTVFALSLSLSLIIYIIYSPSFNHAGFTMPVCSPIRFAGEPFFPSVLIYSIKRSVRGPPFVYPQVNSHIRKETAT